MEEQTWLACVVIYSGPLRSDGVRRKTREEQRTDGGQGLGTNGEQAGHIARSTAGEDKRGNTSADVSSAPVRLPSYEDDTVWGLDRTQRVRR
jgi:hypothetical protein